MGMPLAFVSIFADDLDALGTFYADAFGLSEHAHYRTPIFRSFDLGGGASLALHAHEAYALVGLDDHRSTSGVASMLTFDPGSAEAVDAETQRLVARGATLVKGPYVTVYHARQAVLFDPEGNVVRLSHQLP